VPHIELPADLPGISAGFAFRPETAKPMRELAHVLLHEPNSLTRGERELIATYVSSLNDCYFCQTSHGAAAACHLGDGDVVQQVKTDAEQAPISAKLKSLLVIAGQVQRDGERCRGCAPAGSYGYRDPRYGTDRSGILHVQPLR
jgi:uncharacterized peroxidase-related enzyme